MKTTQTRVLEASFPGRVRCVEAALDVATAPLAAGSNAVCLFVNDDGGADVVNALADQGVRFIAMRCAGFDRIDLDACAARGIAVARVPAYSPYAVAEHAIALMLALNRQLIKSNARVLQGNYSLSGLVGFDMHGKNGGRRRHREGAFCSVLTNTSGLYRPYTRFSPIPRCQQLIASPFN